MKILGFGGSESVSETHQYDGSGKEIQQQSSQRTQNTVEQASQPVAGAPSGSEPLSILTSALMGIFSDAVQSEAGAKGHGPEAQLLLSFVQNIAAHMLEQPNAPDLVKSAESYLQSQPALWSKQGEASTSGYAYRSPDGQTYAGASANAQGQVSVGPNGLDAAGRAEAKVGARVSGHGKTSGSLGSAEGSYTAAVEARAAAEGRAHVGPTGASASGSVYAGVEANAEADGRLESASLVNVGGVPVTAYAGGKASARAGAYAEASCDAVVSYAPPEAAVHAEAGAFAGARAGVEATTGVGPASVTGKAEVWAGAGAKANLDAGYRDGKLKVDFGYGLAVGVGGAYQGSFDIDVKKVGDMATGLLGPVFGAAVEQALVASVLTLADTVNGRGSPQKGAPAGAAQAAQPAPTGELNAAPPSGPVVTPQVAQQSEDDSDGDDDQRRQDEDRRPQA